MRTATSTSSAGCRPIGRSVVKLYGSYMAPFGTQFGVNFYGGSGTPLSTYVVTGNQTNVFVNGRGDMGRTDVLTRTDFLVSHELKLGDGNKRLRLELNLLNAFNQKTSRHEFNFLNRGAGAPRQSSSINLSDRRPAQRLRLQRPDQRLGGRRQRLRPALRQGRPLRAGHAGLLHGSFPLLSPRGGALRAAVLGLFDCRTKAGCPRASGLFCVRPGAYPDRLFGVMNPKTPDGVPEKEWAKVTKLALAAAAASGKADDAAAADVTQKLLAMLEALEQKFGPLPGILAARADFLDDPDEAVRLLERAYKIAGQRADVESRLTIADALAGCYIRELEDPKQGARWLAAMADALKQAGDENDVESYEELKADLAALQVGPPPGGE